jgi:hypothetical protein
MILLDDFSKKVLTNFVSSIPIPLVIFQLCKYIYLTNRFLDSLFLPSQFPILKAT